VRQTFSSFLHQTLRLYNTSDGNADIEGRLEISFDLGPLPSHTEIVARFSTDIDNGLSFHTDSNGYQYMPREIKWNEEIQGNYYPIVYGAFINDRDAQLSLISCRSHGGSSLSNGQLEVMVHRNPDMGDGFGPGLTDITEVYPVLNVVVDKPQTSMAQVHRQSYLRNFPVGLFSAPAMSPSQWTKNYMPTSQLLSADLPPNVHVQGLNALDAISNKAILRFAHIFAKGEDPNLSDPAVINLKSLLGMFNIRSIQETTVSANQVIVPNPGLNIVMTPADIRTFIVDLAKQ